jgi:intein/homing endonuclease
MVYACRGGFKTLSAAILETMVILHTKRNVAHMAAIEPQAKKSASYIKNFFKEPVLRDFTVGDNARELQVERYVHKKTNNIISLDEFQDLDVVSQNLYDRKFNYLKLVICTMAGANCVAPETLITKSDNTLSPAWSIEAGDEILSFDTKTHEWVVNDVQKVDFSIKETLELKFSNGGIVVVSEDHPVFSDSGFRRARTLRKNMGFWFCGSFSSPDSIVSEVEIDPAKDSDPWQIIWGSLLGDSSIQWPRNSAGIKYGVGPRISCFHSHKQSQLLEILSEALKKIGVSSIIIKDKDGFKLQSQPSSVLIDTYNALIIGDKKTVTPQFLNRLQPEGLAMWFADDGSGGPEDIGSTKGNSISISTCGFSIEENHLIVDWLKERFKITANVRTVSNQSKKKWPIVKMDKINARLFSSIVWDYVPSCVRYKLLVPHSWLDTFCVETGQHMAAQPNRTVGFRRLVKVTKDQRKWRKKWELFSKQFTGSLVSIRPVGRRVMLDLVLNAEPTSHNFVANNFLLLHNSEHVEFFCVDGNTKILIRSKNLKRDRKQATARGIFERLAGRNTGGRPGGETTEEILNPVGNVEFLALDIDTGILEFQPVVRAQRHFRDTLTIKTGSKIITVTHDHPLFVYGKGYVQAHRIVVGDRLLQLGKAKTEAHQTPLGGCDTSSLPSSLPAEGDVWEQVVMGGLFGDCGIYKKPQNNPYLQEQHSIKQKEYMEWKKTILSRKLRTVEIAAASGFSDNEMVGFRSGCSPLLLPYLNLRKNPWDWIPKLTGLGLAVWYMDDGCAGNGFRLSTENYTEEENLKLAEALRERFGFDLSVNKYTRDGATYYYLKGGVAEKRRLVEIVRNHIHPEIAYKFDLESNKGLCRFCGLEYWFYEQGRSSLNCGSALCQKIQKGSYKLVPVTNIVASGKKWVYDFTLAKTHNFFGNGLLNHQCIDEVDVVLKQNVPAYYQAQNIPDPRDGLLPLTLLTSTRKSRVGLVQQEIDQSEKTGLHINHWNLIDITQRCEPARHRPEEPKQVLYVNDDLVHHIPKEEFEVMNPGQKVKWYPVEGFAGCKSCRLFAACKGRLATHQTSNSSLLKPIEFALEKFQSAPTPEFLNTEYLCFTEDALVTMSDGTLKPISEVKEGDSVITHLGNIQKVTGVMNRHYEGPLVVIEPGTRNKHWGTIRATPEHPFWVGERFQEAKDLMPWEFDKWGGLKKAGTYLSFPSHFYPSVQSISVLETSANPKILKTEQGRVFSIKSKNAKDLPQEIQLTNEFGWIVGYFLAEGSVITYSDGTYKNVAFASDRRETDFHMRVRDFFGTVYEHPTSSENGYVQVINSCIWANLFDGLCGRFSDEKKLHYLLMSGPEDFQKGVLDGFNAGDGTKGLVSDGELTTTSLQLASQLSVICGRLGLCPRIQKIKTVPNKKQAYRVYYRNFSVPHKQKRTKFKFENGQNLYRLTNKSYQDFSGKVYNIEVAVDNSYIVNGVAVHNCRKPDSTGLVYPRLNKEIHMLTADQMAQLIDEDIKGPVGKARLIQLLKEKGARFYAGMDFGFTHLFAVVVIAVFGQYVFVIDCYAQSGLELEDQINNSSYLKDVYGNCTVYADPAYPGSIKSFRTKGYSMKKWDKGPGSVKSGIEIVRSYIWNARSKARLLFLKDDEGVATAFAMMERYKLKMDVTGKPTEEPDETDDDIPDALRYVVMNVLGRKEGLKDATADKAVITTNEPQTSAGTQSNWLKTEINKALGMPNDSPTDSGGKVRKGRFFFSG